MSIFESLLQESEKYNFEFIDIKDYKAKQYMDKDSYCKMYKDYINKYKNGEIVINTIENILVGTIFIGNEKRDKGFISGLGIKSKYRRLGLATRLLDDAVKKYGGYDLIVKKDNVIAINMYKKYGFRFEKSRETAEYYYMTLN